MASITAYHAIAVVCILGGNGGNLAKIFERAPKCIGSGVVKVCHCNVGGRTLVPQYWEVPSKVACVFFRFRALLATLLPDWGS